MKGSVTLALVLVVGGFMEGEMLPEGMKQLTGGFIKVFEACKTELGLKDGMLTDMYHLWREEYDQVSPDAGCMFGCMSKKLDLLDASGKVHHGNTKEYVMQNGGGEDLAAQLLSISQECEKQHEGIEVECARMLEMAKCFRSGIKRVQWSPKMEVVITEIIADV